MNSVSVQQTNSEPFEKSRVRILKFNMAEGDSADSPVSAAPSRLSAHTPNKSFNYLGALFGLVAWTKHFGISCWASAIHQCEIFESMPKVVHGIDCGGRLAFFVPVAVLACSLSGYLVGAAITPLLRRGGATTVETASGSNGQKRTNRV